MKTRRPMPKPCERKGEDGHESFKHCSIKDLCQSLGYFLDLKSKGTKVYKKNFDTKFKGCFDVEDHLIKNYQLRYDAREVTGLEVLFNGIEKIHDLNAGIFNNAFLEGLENDDYVGTEIDTGEHHNTTREKLASAIRHEHITSSSFRDSEEAEGLKNTIPNAVDVVNDPFEDSRLQMNLPKCLSMNPGMMADLWNDNPKDLFTSMLMQKWNEGLFENEDLKIRIMAYFMMKGFLDKDVITKLYVNDKSDEYKNAQKKVKDIIKKQMPEWAKKFSKYLKLLTDKQKQAIKNEYFYLSEEKPTQAEVAKRLKIGLDAYKERLELAYKKLEKLYPEFKRIKRRNKNDTENNLKVIPKLYLIDGGNKKEIPPTKKTKKNISEKLKREIIRWTYETTYDRAKNINRSHFAAQEFNTNYWKRHKITIKDLEREEQENLLQEEMNEQGANLKSQATAQ